MADDIEGFVPLTDGPIHISRLTPKQREIINKLEELDKAIHAPNSTVSLNDIFSLLIAALIESLRR